MAYTISPIFDPTDSICTLDRYECEQSSTTAYGQVNLCTQTDPSIAEFDTDTGVFSFNMAQPDPSYAGTYDIQIKAKYTRGTYTLTRQCPE